jgi:hypothetical protein
LRPPPIPPLMREFHRRSRCGPFHGGSLDRYAAAVRRSWLARRVAANTGVSTAAGAAVLGIGLAVLAGPKWVAAPLVAIGAGWVIWTLILSMVVSVKTDGFRKQLARAMRKGEELHQAGAPSPDVESWQACVQDMIVAALGEAENRRFLSSAGYVFYGDPARVSFVDGRLRRLNELAARSDLRVDLRFDHRREWV